MSETAPSADGQQQAQPGIQIITQYVKDSSFENPHAPESLVAGWGAPEPTVQISLAQRHIKDNMFEVGVGVRVEAKSPQGGGKVSFIIDLHYGAFVALLNIQRENQLAALMVEVPKLLFPFIREIVAGMTIKGGYPPLFLVPVNFEFIYMNELKRLAAEQQGKQAAGTA